MKKPSCILLYLDIGRKTYSLLATRTFLVKVFRLNGRPSTDCTVYYYYYYSFPLFFVHRFLRNGWTDLLETFRKDALYQYLGRFFSFVENSLPVGKYGRFSVFKKSFCPAVFSKTVKDRVVKFSGMTDLSIGVADRGLSISAVTSCRHRKWKKKSKF